LKLTDSAYREQAAAFRIFLHNHREALKNAERIERITRGVCNRFKDSAYRLGADAFKRLITFWMKNNKSEDELR